MKRVTLLLAVFFIVSVYLNAQNQRFANGDGGFENCWRTVTPHQSTGKEPYEDLEKNYFLTTLNSLYGLTDDEGKAPITAERIIGDAYDGYSSLKLISQNMTVADKIVFLPGAAGTLEIIIDPDDPNGVGGDCNMGEPFSAQPSAITGYYKYTPVDGDAAAIEVQLIKNGRVVAGAKQLISERTTNWLKFHVPISYNSLEMPDLIIVVFSASAGYDFTNISTLLECKGGVGSTLCLDNIEFEYDSVYVGVKEIFDPAVKLNVYPNPSKEYVNIQIAKETKGTVVVYDYLVRKIGEYSINGTQTSIDIKDYAAGSYLINVVENGKVITTSRFVKE